MENGITSILRDPTWFSLYFERSDPSGKHNKCKNRVFRNECYFNNEKNKPESDFLTFQVQFGHHFGQHFAIIRTSFSKPFFEVGSGMAVDARRGHPGHILDKGGTNRHPESTQEAPSSAHNIDSQEICSVQCT